MKNLLAMLSIVGILISSTACNKGPHCPAYNSVHNTKDYGYNPNNKKRKAEDNKKDIEKRKEAELNAKPPKRSNSYGLFPKGMR